MSRRRLFGLLGGAAAVGTGLAVAGSALGADPAGATTVTLGGADGDALQLGGFNSCTSATGINSGNGAQAFVGTATSAAGGTGIQGQSTNGAGIGVSGVSNQGYGLVGNGGRAPLYLVPAGTTGAPTGGTHNRGELFVDTNGQLFQCIVGNGTTPGTWVRQSPLVTLAPARVYDSRVGQLPATGPKAPIANTNTVTLDVTGPKAGGGNSGVPAGASTVLGNVTVINGVNPGVFLTIYAAGTSAPATSSVNASSGGIVANNFTSQIGTTGMNANRIAITCGGGPTDFIIDIVGYYP